MDESRTISTRKEHIDDLLNFLAKLKQLNPEGTRIPAGSGTFHSFFTQFLDSVLGEGWKLRVQGTHTEIADILEGVTNKDILDGFILAVKGLLHRLPSLVSADGVLAESLQAKVRAAAPRSEPTALAIRVIVCLKELPTIDRDFVITRGFAEEAQRWSLSGDFEAKLSEQHDLGTYERIKIEQLPKPLRRALKQYVPDWKRFKEAYKGRKAAAQADGSRSDEVGDNGAPAQPVAAGGGSSSTLSSAPPAGVPEAAQASGKQRLVEEVPPAPVESFEYIAQYMANMKKTHPDQFKVFMAGLLAAGGASSSEQHAAYTPPRPARSRQDVMIQTSPWLNAPAQHIAQPANDMPPPSARALGPSSARAPHFDGVPFTPLVFPTSSRPPATVLRSGHPVVSSTEVCTPLVDLKEVSAFKEKLSRCSQRKNATATATAAGIPQTPASQREQVLQTDKISLQLTERMSEMSPRDLVKEKTTENKEAC